MLVPTQYVVFNAWWVTAKGFEKTYRDKVLLFTDEKVIVVCPISLIWRGQNWVVNPGRLASNPARLSHCWVRLQSRRWARVVAIRCHSEQPSVSLQNYLTTDSPNLKNDPFSPLHWQPQLQSYECLKKMCIDLKTGVCDCFCGLPLRIISFVKI